MRRLIVRAAAACLPLLCLAPAAFAADALAFPTKPIKIIVPYSPGGLPDMAARLVADNLGARVGQPVFVENRPGANGTIGAAAVARAEPDGYTIGLFASSHVFSRALMPSLPFDPVKDFAPITMAVRTPVVLVAAPSLPAKNMAEALAYVRAHPDTLAYASAGSGSNTHVFGRWFVDAAGLKMVHVPYKGSAAAHVDIISGQVALAFDTLPSVRALVAAGKVRLLAIAGARRLPQYPDVPTVAEAASVPGYDVDSWAAVLAPAKTPQPVIDRLNREIVAILKSDKVQAQLRDAGAQVVAGTPRELGAVLVSEEKRYGELIRRLGITLD
jgi:tripartite-type tricarboxylate transporter receptor subunit TctC